MVPETVHLLHSSEDSRLCNFRDVDEDIVRWVTIQWCTETLLVKMVTNETDATTQNEETVQGTDLHEQ